MRLLFLFVTMKFVLLTGCASRFDTMLASKIHNEATVLTHQDTSTIPQLVPVLPLLSEPIASPKTKTFSVVVSRVPVHDLLFALGRDAQIDLDVHPAVQGHVTINAFNQTLPELMNRLQKQLDLCWSFEGNVLTVAPDTSFLKTYSIDYFNMTRNVKSNVSLANAIGTTGGSVNSKGQGVMANSSSTYIENESQHQFWKRLEDNLKDLLQVSIKKPPENEDSSKAMIMPNQVIIYPETGTMTVRANRKDHAKVAEYLASVQAAAQRQVLIEAAVVEVALNDKYQAGVDWDRLAHGAGWSFAQTLTGAHLATAPLGGAQYHSSLFSASIKMLEQFGTVHVLSNPKVIALNNQTAAMKVVEELVYFTLKVEEEERESSSKDPYTKTRYTSELRTVPIGLMLQVTPYIAESGLVSLHIRPTITNVSGYVEDPAYNLYSADKKRKVKSLIPTIQVREFDSTLQIENGQLAVLGGLIQDVQITDRKGLPLLSRLPLVGSLFSYRDDMFKKIELIIFLRPLQIKEGNHELTNHRSLVLDKNFFGTMNDQKLSVFHRD